MARRFVSAGRDLDVERTLSRSQRAMIQRFDELRAAMARASEAGWLPRIRWTTLYKSLGGEDLDARREATEFIEDKIAELEADLPQARARGEQARAEQDWEAQAHELEYWHSPAELERRYAGQDVWLWHGTSTAVWPQIQREGLLAMPPRSTHGEATPGFVYLTADPNHAVDFYARRAASVFGGKPLLLRVAVPWDELRYDDDDADIPSGRVQFMLPRTLYPHEIREAGDEKLVSTT